MIKKNILITILFFVIIACNKNITVKDGYTAYELKRYAQAVELLQDEYQRSNKEAQRLEKARLLALSYLKLNQPEEAEHWYSVILEYERDPDILKQIAGAYKKLEKYDRAIEIMQSIDYAPAMEVVKNQEIAGLRQAKNLLKKRENGEYEVSPSDLNSPANEYGLIPYLNGHLLFTTDRVFNSEERYAWFGNSYFDIVEIKDVDDFPFNFSPIINSEKNEGTPAFNKDFTEIIFTRCSDEEERTHFCALYHSRRNGNIWTEPEQLNFIEDQVNYSQPFLDSEREILFFSSNLPETGEGGYDIYFSSREKGNWTYPEPLSSRINSPGNEGFPYLYKDTLYFSSDYHPGMGGMDIFYSTLRDDGSWSAPQNPGAPLNSGGDDFAFYIDSVYTDHPSIMAEGFFSSTRAGGDGGDDIYTYVKKRVIEEEPEIEYTLTLEGKVVQPVYKESGHPSSGIVRTEKLSNVRLEIFKDDLPLDVFKTGLAGTWKMDLEYGHDYKFIASKEGYLRNVKVFSTQNIPKDPIDPHKTYLFTILLDPLIEGVEFTINNIYYDFDKANIREDARAPLDTLAQILKLNPGINIQLASHTDCRGDDDYNMALSQRRAQAVVNYLIDAGISSRRLSAIGYGESRPLVNCTCDLCTEEEHQLNRRTTFKIIG